MMKNNVCGPRSLQHTVTPLLVSAFSPRMLEVTGRSLKYQRLLLILPIRHLRFVFFFSLLQEMHIVIRKRTHFYEKQTQVH